MTSSEPLHHVSATETADPPQFVSSEPDCAHRV